MEENEWMLKNGADILSTASQALEHDLCDRCLGRLFGKSGFGLTNLERGRAARIMLALSYELLSSVEGKKDLAISGRLPVHRSKQVEEKSQGSVEEDDGWNRTGTMSLSDYLENDTRGSGCWLCQDVFDSVDEMAAAVLEASRSQEFSSFMIGCRMDPGSLERERVLWERCGPTSAETLKEELNREIGKAYSDIAPEKEFDRSNPEVTFLVDPLFKTVKVSIKPVFIRGRYRKLERGIPQTRWICKSCRGKGCSRCGGKGKMYETSVEEIIGEPVRKTLDGTDFKLHGMGREDVDVLTLGSGRPFVLEITSPKRRSLDLAEETMKINDHGSGKVEVMDLETSERSEIADVKDGTSLKRYRARILVEGEVDEETLKYNISLLAQSPINQRTPWRVSHRRADKVRVRRVHSASANIDREGAITVDLLTDGGLYIKELFHGDEGRTTPSLASLLGLSVKVETLDVLGVLDGERSVMDRG
ncbi:MAG: tRNA pseudouridine(54/55) synthase Pus10 [Thermoplasmatota archaeon]